MTSKPTKLAVAAIGLGLSTHALATNGDVLIGIGPISRALGGTGVAAPQDAISAVFSNPAAMCISPSCAAPQADVALTLFMPEPSAGVFNAFGNFASDSDDAIYPIPAIGASFPLTGNASRWRVGVSAYGVSGLGVDYRGGPLANKNTLNFFGPGAPLVAGFYTDLAIMKFAPSVSYALSPELSLGFSGHLDYATLDLGLGAKNDIGWGGQLGLVWKPVKDLSVGLTYISPQSTTFDNVFDFDGNSLVDSLELEAPQQVSMGIAWTGLDDRLLVEFDWRWINWSDAAGYDAFDWDDEWVLGLGVQYEAIPQKLFLRAGYNYGTNPVNKHNGWNGGMRPGGPGEPPFVPADMVNVQGKMVPRYYYESFRIIGFPAIVQHHLTLGVGWQINPDLVLNLAFVHAFDAGISEVGTDFSGQSTVLHSSLSENTVDLGLTWRY